MNASDLARTLAPLVAAAAIGCSKTPTVPNPFNTADRVPPPPLHATPGAQQPYYTPGAGSSAPGQTTPSGYPAAPAPAAPGYAPTPTPGQATPNYGPPGGSASRGLSNSAQVAGGDVVAVPTDAGALRFASPSESALARRESGPIDRGDTGQMLASSDPARRPATASGWIAGSAPVRRDAPEASPRVRMPGDSFDREPVSVAAIQRGVPVAPLEPAPTGARPGEPAPLRVASPPSTTGWR